MRSKSIQRKTIATITWVLFITGAITISAVMLITYQQMSNQKFNDLKKLSLEKSDKISTILKNSSDLSEYINTFPEVVKWTENPDKKNTEDALKFLNNFNIKKQYSAIYLLNKDGVAVVSTEPTFTGNNYSFRPYFKKAINGQANMDVAIGVTSHLQGYYFSQPVKTSDQKIIGVLVLKLSPESLYKDFDLETRDINSHLMLSDQFGVILYSDVKERIFSSLGPLSAETLNNLKANKKFLDIEIKPLQYSGAQEILAWPKKDASVYKFFDKNDNASEIIAVSPVKGYPLFMVNEDDSVGISTDATRLTAITSLLILLSILIVIFSLSLLISKKLEPLKELREMTKKIGNGDLKIKNTIKSGDELEDLGVFFSEMAQKLNEYYDNLEEKISERTKELNIKNEYLNKTKTATINILEDVENERNKVVELAKNLEKFKLALDNASDHIVITDSNGIVLYGNNGVENITGYSLSEALGKKAGALWSLPMPKEYYEKMWKTIKTDKKTFDSEIKNRRKNGQIYDARITISPVLNEHQEVEFFVGIEKDITHEKMVDQAKTEFVSLASHQLRTPLSSIGWYAEMLLAGDGGKLNKEQNSFVKEIYAGNQRMVELVNALLNVSRLELGTFAVDPEPTDIIKTAKSVFKELNPDIIQKKIKIDFNYDKDMPIIQADPKLLRMVLQNLLSNSIKYTPKEGSISLRITKKKLNLLIEVEDTGYGIPEQEKSRIFEKLFRAKNVREKDTEGTGLGLYIVKSIVDNSGGKIYFKSKENKGTIFYLEIPLSGMKKKEGDKKIE